MNKSAPVVCIMQPTYLPWIGYFDLIRQSDIFVFLDSVSFSKQSWQQRNQIKGPQGLQLLTVPVLSKGKSEQRIVDVTIDSKHSFAKKHLKSIELNYRRAPNFSVLFPELSKIYLEAEEHLSLCTLNMKLIGFFCTQLGWARTFSRSTELKSTGERSHLLVGILRELQSKDYLSPMGAAEYLQEDRTIFGDAGISVRLHQYKHPEYRQLYPPFVPYASILDLLMNESSADANRILASGAAI